MVLTFAETMPQKKLTAGQHADKLDALADKLATVQRRTPSEMDAIWKRDRAIQIALGSSRSLNNLSVKMPDGVVLTPEELKLAQWVFQYSTQETLPVKEAMAQIFDYLRRNPKEMAGFTKGDVSFAESLSDSNSRVAPDEFSASQRALKLVRRAHLYQAVAGCSFCEAVGAIE